MKPIPEILYNGRLTIRILFRNGKAKFVRRNSEGYLAAVIYPSVDDMISGCLLEQAPLKQTFSELSDFYSEDDLENLSWIIG